MPEKTLGHLASRGVSGAENQNALFQTGPLIRGRINSST
jgi:hypothetical protein